MDSVLQKLAQLKQGKVYQATKFKMNLYKVKQSETDELEEFGAEEDWDQAVSWNYVSILEKMDEEKEENGILPTVSFGPSSKNLLGYIDLNNLEVLDRETGINRFAQSLSTTNDVLNSEALDDYSGLPIVPCNHPVGLFHMMILLHPNQNLPQLIGPEVAEDIFLIAGIFLQASGAVVGFNSLNAGSASNRLHVELLLSPSFSKPSSTISEEQGWPTALPMLDSKGELLFMGRLSGPEEYPDYSVVVELTRHEDHPTKYFKLELKDPLAPEDAEEFDWAQVHASISSFAIAELVGLRLPHNIVWLNSGRTILLFPRSHIPKYSHWGWPEMVGLHRFPDASLTTTCSVEDKEFREITEGVKTVLVQRLSTANSNEPN